MSGNKNLQAMQSAADLQKHLNLVQPKRAPALGTAEQQAAVREKIRVRAKGKEDGIKALAIGSGKGKKVRESKLVPAGGAGMGMGMNVDA